MKEILRIIIIIIFFYLPSSIFQLVYAAFYEEINIGARAVALGGAFEAETQDVSGIFYNPASLTNLKGAEIFTAYESMYLGLSDESSLKRVAFSAGAPLNIKQKYFGTAGINYYKFELSDLYEETIIGIIHGYPIKRNLFYGLQLKVLKVGYGKTKYTEINPVFEGGYNKYAFGQDIGVIYILDNMNFGFSILNINQPDVGLKHKNKVKRNIRTGLSIKMNKLNLSSAVTYFQSSIRFRAGFETWFFSKRLFLRGGMNLGSWDYRNISVGFGYARDKYKIDYAWKYPLSGINDILGSHQLSFNYCFELFKVKEEEIKEKEEISIEGLEEPISVYLIEKPVDIPQEEVLKADSLIKEANGYILSGLFIEAFKKFKEADDILIKNEYVKKRLLKVEQIVRYFPEVKGVGRKERLVRNGIIGYIYSAPHDALNNIIYANQLWPGDRNIRKILIVVKEEFPDIFEEKKGMIGTNMVEQNLEKSLEMIYTGRYSEAVLKCREVLSLEPDNITALTRMGSAFWMMGKKDKAYNIWKKVLKLDPYNKEIIEQMKEYEKERKRK